MCAKYIIENDVPPKECLKHLQRDASSYTDWPFKKMKVDQVVKFVDATTSKERAKIVNYCHNYASRHHLKFVTKTIDGVLNVWRIA